MKKVLIPFDFSESALNALKYACDLFKSIPTTFHALSTNSTISISLASDEYNDELLNTLGDESKAELDKVLMDFQKEIKNSNHNFIAISSSKPMTAAIRECIKNVDIDIIIMGAVSAKTGLEVFIGNSTIKVIDTIDSSPIIVVPSGYKFKDPKQVVLSTNFKRTFNSVELSPLIELIKTLNLKFKIVQIMMEEYLNEVQKKNKKLLIELISDVDYYFAKIDMVSSESQAIRDFVVRTESDMVAFIHHKHSFFNKFTEEDVIKKTSFISPVPMLVLPEIS